MSLRTDFRCCPPPRLSFTMNLRDQGEPTPGTRIRCKTSSWFSLPAREWSAPPPAAKLHRESQLGGRLVSSDLL